MFCHVTKLRGNAQLAKEMVAKSGQKNGRKHLCTFGSCHGHHCTLPPKMAMSLRWRRSSPRGPKWMPRATLATRLYTRRPMVAIWMWWRNSSPRGPKWMPRPSMATRLCMRRPIMAIWMWWMSSSPRVPKWMPRATMAGRLCTRRPLKAIWMWWRNSSPRGPKWMPSLTLATRLCTRRPGRAIWMWWRNSSPKGPKWMPRTSLAKRLCTRRPDAAMWMWWRNSSPRGLKWMPKPRMARHAGSSVAGRLCTLQPEVAILDVVQELLSNGADTNAKSRDGKTPFQLAHHEDVLKALVRQVIKLAQRAQKPNESKEAPKIVTDTLQARCLPEVAQWAVNHSYAIDDFPGDASTARSCVLQYMELWSKKKACTWLQVELRISGCWSRNCCGMGVRGGATDFATALVQLMLGPKKKEAHFIMEPICWWPRLRSNGIGPRWHSGSLRSWASLVFS